MTSVNTESEGFNVDLSSSIHHPEGASNQKKTNPIDVKVDGARGKIIEYLAEKFKSYPTSLTTNLQDHITQLDVKTLKGSEDCKATILAAIKEMRIHDRRTKPEPIPTIKKRIKEDEIFSVLCKELLDNEKSQLEPSSIETDNDKKNQYEDSKGEIVALLSEKFTPTGIHPSTLSTLIETLDFMNMLGKNDCKQAILDKLESLVVLRKNNSQKSVIINELKDNESFNNLCKTLLEEEKFVNKPTQNNTEINTLTTQKKIIHHIELALKSNVTLDSIFDLLSQIPAAVLDQLVFRDMHNPENCKSTILANSKSKFLEQLVNVRKYRKETVENHINAFINALEEDVAFNKLCQDLFDQGKQESINKGKPQNKAVRFSNE